MIEVNEKLFLHPTVKIIFDNTDILLIRIQQKLQNDTYIDRQSKVYNSSVIS